MEARPRPGRRVARSLPAGLIPGTRRFAVKPYILTVRLRDGVVEIAAIRHAKQSHAYKPRETIEDDEADEPENNSSFKIG